MIAYYFIPIDLMEILRQIAQEFESQGGYICLTAVESPGEDIANPRPKSPTGIIAQQGEIYVSDQCKGFALEGDLERYGYRDTALSIGCTEYDTAEEFLNFIHTLQ